MGLFGGSTPTVTPNSLRSQSYLRVIDLWGEGPIVGLVSGLMSVYYDDVPVVAPDGSYNFLGTGVHYALGTETQGPSSSLLSASQEFDYNVRLLWDKPETHTLDNPDYTNATLIFNVPALESSDTKGNVYGSDVSFNIYARYYGGSYVKLKSVDIVGKCTSEYQQTVDIRLPQDPTGTTTGWDIKVTKTTFDSDSAAYGTLTVVNDVYWQGMVGEVRDYFTYPYSAYADITLVASYFGTSVPVRSYELKGLIIQVPSNYDPDARTYVGIWDGTFKYAYTNNPAWVIYDLLTNDRYGLGEYVDAGSVDKWSFYEVSTYCDEMVPNGYAGMEPRFTFNGQLSGSREAFESLSAVASACRCMLYWSSGAVMISQDRPKDPVMIVTPANAVDGNFSYQSSAMKARHTAATVRFNDPLQNYNEDWESIEDGFGIARYGYREVNIEAVGCTSRGQARRLGLWTILTELYNTQTLTYRAGLDHAVIVPGDIVSVQDPSLINSDWGGRLRPGSTQNRLVLDRSVSVDPTMSYVISVLMPSGQVVEQPVSAFMEAVSGDSAGATADSGTDLADAGYAMHSQSETPWPNDTAGSLDVTADGNLKASDAGFPRYGSLLLAGSLPDDPVAGSVWVLSSATADPTLFQVIGKKEVSANVYEITAVEHTPSIFDQVDAQVLFDPNEPPSTATPGTVTNLSAREEQYYNGGYVVAAFLSWTKPQYNAPLRFHVTGDGPSGFVDFGTTAYPSITLSGIATGSWVFHVASLGAAGKESAYVDVPLAVTPWTAAAPTIANLALGNATATPDNTYAEAEPTITWDDVFPDGTDPYPVVNHIVISHTDGGAVLRTVDTTDTVYTYAQADMADDGGPWRNLTFTVTAVSPNGTLGTGALLMIGDPPPPVATVSATDAGNGTVSVDISSSANLPQDLAGGLIFVSTSLAQVDPSTATPVAQATNFPATFTVQSAGTYYVSVALYDNFSEKELLVSAPVKVSVAQGAPAPSTQGTPTDYMASGHNLDLDNPPNGLDTSEDLDNSPGSQYTSVNLDGP